MLQGLVEVRSLTNLVDTAFGRAVPVKVVLFGGIVALGAVDRRRLPPALAGYAPSIAEGQARSRGPRTSARRGWG